MLQGQLEDIGGSGGRGGGDEDMGTWILRENKGRLVHGCKYSVQARQAA